MKENGKQPAFSQSCTSDGYQSDAFEGLSKREYFAAKAMQGLITAGWDKLDVMPEAAKRSVEFADMLLKELEK